MSNLLDALLGGLGYVGNALDTYSGASSLRDLVAGDDPFDQLLDPQNQDKRVTGRQMLEKRGWADENTDQGWIPDAGVAGWQEHAPAAARIDTKKAPFVTGPESLAARGHAALCGLCTQLDSLLIGN